MTVQVWSHTPDPSAFYRLLEPARVLGVEVVEDPHLVTADTVVTNRPILPAIADQIEAWRDMGRRVVVDIDDDMDHLPVRHGIAGRFPTEPLHRACQLADVVTCSTPALVDLYGYGHGIVVRNCVPGFYPRPIRYRQHRPWIGWVGSMHAHPDDPAKCGDGVLRAVQAVGGAFAFVGLKEDTDALKLALSWPDTQPGVVPLGTVALSTLPSVLCEFDAGIVPLAPHRFSLSKSWLKGLEYAAAGVPGVASPTPEYRYMASLGGCLLADGPNEWFEQLHRLLTDPSLRADRIAAGYSMVRDWTYEHRAHEWADIWAS